jgi:hypothetical protein
MSFISQSDRKRETKRNFSIERFFPVNAEEISSRTIGNGDHQLVIVVTVEPVVQQLYELEKRGYWIAAIVPEFLLALRFLQRTNSMDPNCEVYMKESDGHWSFGELMNGNLIRWEWLNQQEVLEPLSESVNKKRYVVSPDELDLPLESLGAESVNRTQEQLALEEEKNILHGNSSPLVDFRGEGIPARDPLRFIVVPFAAFLYSLIAALFTASLILILNSRYATNQADLFRRQQEQTFAEQLPNSKIPMDIPSRLRSELKKAELTDSQSKDLPRLESSIPALTKFLSTIPGDGVFRLDAFRTEGTTVSRVTGVAETLKDFELLLNSLRSNGFEFPNPSLNQTGSDFYGFQMESVRLILGGPS